jgi:hypothetical protein
MTSKEGGREGGREGGERGREGVNDCFYHQDFSQKLIVSPEVSHRSLPPSLPPSLSLSEYVPNLTQSRLVNPPAGWQPRGKNKEVRLFQEGAQTIIGFNFKV